MSLTGVSGPRRAGAVNLLSTVHMKLVDRGMADADAHALVQQCFNPYAFYVDYATQDPRGRPDTRGVKLLKAEADLHSVVRTAAALLRSNGTLGGGNTTWDWCDLALPTTAQMNHDSRDFNAQPGTGSSALKMGVLVGTTWCCRRLRR